jgi:hypothetical protein
MRGGGGGEMSAKRRYTGELVTPISLAALPTFEGAVTDKRVKRFWESHRQHQQEADNRARQKLLEKLSLLMRHFGIADENDMGALALALAIEHVPGFQIVPEAKTKRGRKRKWDGLVLQDLLTAVQLVKKQHRYNDRQALTFLASSHDSPWRPPSSHKGSKRQWIETLESRLQDAKRIEKMARSAAEALQRISQGLHRKFRK